MVVVDASALIPLARIGELELLEMAFKSVHTPEPVDEVLVEGKRGTAALERFLEDSTRHPVPDGAERVAELEGIAVTDAAVVRLAGTIDQVLLANDKALIEVAESHGVEPWWVTTLVLHCVTEDQLAAERANGVLYDLVDAGMNLHPKVYANVRRAIEDLAE